MFSVKFWRDAAERAVKTVAQALLLFGGGDLALDKWALDWSGVAYVAAGAALLSLLTSLASLGVGDKETASLVRMKTGD